jgi:hypothetical protein
MPAVCESHGRRRVARDDSPLQRHRNGQTKTQRAKTRRITRSAAGYRGKAFALKVQNSDKINNCVRFGARVGANPTPADCRLWY